MKPDPESLSDGYCESCGHPCQPIIIDLGIGPYEFQGTRGIDHDYVVVSDCCESLILESSPFCIECGDRSLYEDDRCFNCYEAMQEVVN